MHTLWQSPCERNCVTTHDDPFPCLTNPGTDVGDCPMNAWNAAEMSKLAAELYKAGYPYGVWAVHLDAAGLFPVCELIFMREEPTEEALREKWGNRLLRFAAFNPHAPRRRGNRPALFGS